MNPFYRSFLSLLLLASALLQTSPLLAAPLEPASYQLYVPAKADKQRALPLVVVIHGCLQNAADMAVGTGWNNLADQQGFVVLYPNQTPGQHKLNCWNWFSPGNQARGQGEPAAIVAAINEIRRLKRIDPTQIFVAGMSSGAATTATLLSCYPELFRAGAIHSGPAYGLVKDENEALQLLSLGPLGFKRQGPCEPEKYTGRVMVIHGALDNVVNPLNAVRVITEFIPNATSRETSLSMPFGQLSTSRVDYFVDKKLRGSLISVAGLGHQWSGGRKELPFNNPFGPNATELMWTFFKSEPAASAPVKP